MLKGHRGTFGVMDMFYILIRVVVAAWGFLSKIIELYIKMGVFILVHVNYITIDLQPSKLLFY